MSCSSADAQIYVAIHKILKRVTNNIAMIQRECTEFLHHKPWEDPMIISAEVAGVTFAICNSARVLAYIPQIVRIARDRNGSPGVSCLTWTGFAAANFSTVAYALILTSDWNMAAVFGVNGVFCSAIVTLTMWKRLRAGALAASTRRLALPNLRYGNFFAPARVRAFHPGSHQRPR